MKKLKITKLPNGGELHEHSGGHKLWFLNGPLHREDGPAMILANGAKLWFINGKEVTCKTQKEFERLMKLKAFW